MVAMSTATFTNKHAGPTRGARTRRAPATTTSIVANGRHPAARDVDVENFVIRIPGVDDRQLLAELAERAGAETPSGGLLVAANDGHLLAALSTATGEALVEPTQSGTTAEAILRCRLAQLRRRRTRLRRPGTPS
jgi:hypothetical protein